LDFQPRHLSHGEELKTEFLLNDGAFILSRAKAFILNLALFTLLLKSRHGVTNPNCLKKVMIIDCYLVLFLFFGVYRYCGKEFLPFFAFEHDRIGAIFMIFGLPALIKSINTMINYKLKYMNTNSVKRRRPKVVFLNKNIENI
jgi:hypothetical protein